MLNGKKSFNFSDKVHSKDGKIATVIGIVCAAVLIVLLVRSIMTNGTLGKNCGLLGMIDFFVTLYGFGLSVFSLKEEDIIKTFCISGIVVNGITMLLLAALFIYGV